jgi:Tfp pilus assembly protein PilO
MPKELSQQQKKLILAAIIAFIVLYIDFAYILRMQIANFKGVSQKLKQIRTDLSRYSENSPYYKSLQVQSQRLRSKYRDIEEYVFSETGLPLLLDDISKKAFSFGVKIMQIKPQAVLPQKEKKTAKDINLGLQQANVLLELTGGYHQIGRFLGALEANPLIETSEVKINSQPGASAIQKAAITLKVYVQKK